jgi:hypothetical protein
LDDYPTTCLKIKQKPGAGGIRPCGDEIAAL